MKLNNRATVLGFAPLILALAVGGCASPSSENDFGNSVRTMMAAQKYVPENQQTPELPGMDGARAAGAVERNRAAPPAPQRIYEGMGGAEL
ncbi:hypothetical protein [Marinobacter sediminum]|uniref:hypothetical protein n=1 Tax=Marinobacter sediminum TaxID=256323 RepID=UPI0035678FFF